jgi:hypothetical protein
MFVFDILQGNTDFWENEWQKEQQRFEEIFGFARHMNW